MLPKNTSKIIEFLLRNIAQQYNINQIANELKISVGSSHKILKKLENEKFVKCKALGNAIYYSLDLENRQTRKVTELVLIESKNGALQKNSRAKVYAKDLQQAEQFSKTIILFGSILEQKEPEDVDVLFLVHKGNVRKVEDLCLRLSSLKPKKIIPLIMTAKDFTNNLKTQDVVVLDILKKGVVLYGEDNLVNALRDL
jgi:DNA-binding Lrp family transcriptional regulator